MGGKKIHNIVLAVVLGCLCMSSAALPFCIRSARTMDGSERLCGGSLKVWSDDFFDTARIDFGLSSNISINTSSGQISMQNTFSAWVDPSFSRMRPIQITNTGVTGLQNYVAEFVIPYDSDMQSDYDDLRFTNTEGVLYQYWILERTVGVQARVLVLIPWIGPLQTITLYMFYGNPAASDQGNFQSVFSWVDLSQPDIMISYKNENEGAWDPDVEFGGGRFFTCWEERVGPEDISIPVPYFERTLPSYIYGRTYDVNGSHPNPPKESGDIIISLPGSTTYHAENPSVAYGAGRFFVCWEENPATLADRFKSDIKGAFVGGDGTVLSRVTICAAEGGQYDPHVCYDAGRNRFLVVWEDARDGSDNYDIWAKTYFPSGTSYGEFCVTAGEVHCQSDPWVCSDGQGNVLVVYDDGYDPQIGPFSLKAKRFSPTGPGGQLVQNGSTITIATGSSSVDHIFPSAVFNPVAQRYLVTWNDADISVDPTKRSSYDGNIWGRILDKNGATVITNFIITPGTSNIRTDVVPFFNTMFFVSYDSILGGSTGIWGKLVSSTGVIHGAEVQLTDGSSQNVDWNNLAVGDGRIFSIWEDERDTMSLYADAFGSVWTITQSVGSPSVSYVVGDEYKRVTQAVVTSTVITPDPGFVRWHRFAALFALNSGSIRFDILDAEGNVLMADVNSFEDLSLLTTSSCRLRATVSRMVPTRSPVLDAWNISWYQWADMEPPQTTLRLEPPAPDGTNNWYVTPIRCILTAYDTDTDPWNVTTYYRINNGEIMVYYSEDPPVISSERADNMIEYWSEDSAENREEHHVVSNIALDCSKPTVHIDQPAGYIYPGVVRINGSVVEYASGSGVYSVEIKLGDDTLYTAVYSGEKNVWFETAFQAYYGETYDIVVTSVDLAGNRGYDRRTITCSDRGIYQIGYVYILDNPKIGPKKLLVTLGLAAVVDSTALFVACPTSVDDAVRVQFVATQLFLKKTFTCEDVLLSDGITGELAVPSGLYALAAEFYDKADQKIATVPLIQKILVILL